MTRKQSGRQGRYNNKSLNARILKNTTLNILALVIICCLIMGLSMYSLANSILLDSLQPMARQSAKTVEANIHMLAARMMTIAADTRMNTGDASDVLSEAAEIYELHSIALYGLDGSLLEGSGRAPASLDSGFFALLQDTDNLTTAASTSFQGQLGISMGMPVKENGETARYVVGVYKYETLNDVIGSINLGRHGMAYMINREGAVTGHPDQSVVLKGTTLAALSGGNEAALAGATSGETGATEILVDGERMHPMVAGYTDTQSGLQPFDQYGDADSRPGYPGGFGCFHPVGASPVAIHFKTG